MTAPTPPRDPVERVARAIVGASVDALSWDDLGADDRETVRMCARVAIAAILELFEQPTAEMISAGVRAFYTGRRPMPEAITSAAKVLLGGTDGE